MMPLWLISVWKGVPMSLVSQFNLGQNPLLHCVSRPWKHQLRVMQSFKSDMSTSTRWPCYTAGCFLSLFLSLSLSQWFLSEATLVDTATLILWKILWLLFCFFDMFSRLEYIFFNIVFPASCVCLSFSYTCAHISLKCQLLAIFYLSVCNQS